MTKWDAVLGAPPNTAQDLPNRVDGKCHGCEREIIFHESCPADVPKLCVSCVAKLVVRIGPGAEIMLPSGRGSLLAS